MNNTIRLGLMLIVLFHAACQQKAQEQNQTAAPVTPEKVSARPTHWGYEGNIGPANWATLDPVYAVCANGMHQSPVNITKIEAGTGVSFKLDYNTIPAFKIQHTEHMEEIIDNGHTIQVSVEEGSSITVEGKAYVLKQFHFHTPSEHTIDGKHMPMEMHMVHQSDDKSLAVVSVMFTIGDVANENIAIIVANLPDAKGDTKHVADAGLNINGALPANSFAYHYIGSLTTPPCSENVQWFVLRDPVPVSADQIEAFHARIGNNNRPVQGLNDRSVMLDQVSVEVD
ncbi:MAG: carbonic anhydrase family protein [Cyclobacteriaceae bacterium]|nr:carbonic anhydrase family protein [Cyclobacteriaceae bacterium]